MKPYFLPIYRLAKLVMSIVCKYSGSCLLQHWNREPYTIMLTVGVIISEHPTSGVVLKSFWPRPEVQNTSRLDHRLLRVVTGLSEGKERL